MDKEPKPLSDQEVEEAAGGIERVTKPLDKEEELEVQRTNFCLKCRSAAYKVLRTETDGTQIRECKTCGRRYKFRGW